MNFVSTTSWAFFCDLLARTLTMRTDSLKLLGLAIHISSLNHRKTFSTAYSTIIQAFGILSACAHTFFASLSGLKDSLGSSAIVKILN
jgi:hypothetical protein